MARAGLVGVSGVRACVRACMRACVCACLCVRLRGAFAHMCVRRARCAGHVGLWACARAALHVLIWHVCMHSVCTHISEFGPPLDAARALMVGCVALVSECDGGTTASLQGVETSGTSFRPTTLEDVVRMASSNELLVAAPRRKSSTFELGAPVGLSEITAGSALLVSSLMT